MHEFPKKIVDVIAQYAPIWLVGGAVRDKLLGVEGKDIDFVTYMKPEYVDYILRQNGLTPQQIGMRFKTFSLFEAEHRVDIVSTEDLNQDAQHRDFTINAIYMNPYTQELYDPWNGSKDLNEKVLKTCGDAEHRFREDPVRILRMVRFAVQYQMNIEEETWNEARDLVALLVSVAKERVTAELAKILVLKDAEKAIRMLEQIGYWDVFVPELARLKGIVQNQYHSLDVWEHTLAVFRGTPENLFLRLAALFHDVGKWEVASRECYVGGRLELENDTFWIGDYHIIGTKGREELEVKLKPHLGKDIKILGANLDQFPDIIQFKKILVGEQIIRGLTPVENGKRHFLNHEKAGVKIVDDILRRYSFSMFFDGGGQKREKDLLRLVENHMKATLVFMPEFRGKEARKSLRDRQAQLVWDLGWDGRDFEVQKIYDFVTLWKADFEAGKVHDEQQNTLFDKISRELTDIALWQKENLTRIDWELFLEFAQAQGLTGPNLGNFKDFVREKLMKKMLVELSQVSLQKLYIQYNALDQRQ